MQAPVTLKRILAHEIVYEDKIRSLSVAELRSDGSVVISPFERETAATVFVSGRVEICAKSGCFVITAGPKIEKIPFYSQVEGV